MVSGGENPRLSWTVSRILQFPFWVHSRMTFPPLPRIQAEPHERMMVTSGQRRGGQCVSAQTFE